MLKRTIGVFLTAVAAAVAVHTVLEPLYHVSGEAGVTREYLAANIQLYGLLCVGILFFWSWFNLLMPAFTAPGDDTASLVWILIDATLPLLLGAMGIHLLRGRE